MLSSFKYFKILYAILITALYGIFIFNYQNIILSLLITSCLTAGILSYIFCRKEDILSDKEALYELIHDIKTPVTSQHRIINLLVKGNFGALSENQKDILIQMNNSTGFVLNMVNNISTLCAYTNGNISDDFEIFDINELIKSFIFDLKYLAADKRCSILFDYSEEKLLVKASKIQISRVLLNLLTNAVNYSYSDRVITVISKTENGRYVFGICSYGDVIDENNMKNIFDKYKSINKTSSGLGLYICNLILKHHGSKMIVKSDKKTGNYFGFELKSVKKATEIISKNT